MAGNSSYDEFDTGRPHGTTSVADLERLYAQYARGVRAYCMRRLGSASDADDALQETFLKVQQSLHRYNPEAPFWPWVVTIAARVCTDMHRVADRVSTGDFETGEAPATEEHAARRATVAIVDRALRSMPGRYRTSIYLKHFEGASYEEIADVQGVSLASVKTTLMRGRRELACRIEAIVRAERHWPLPSTMPVLARRVRHRVRHMSNECNRIAHGAAAVIDSVVSFNVLSAHAPVAMAVVAVLGGGAHERPLPPTPGAALADRPPAASGGGPTSAPPPVITVGNRRTGVTVAAQSPPPPPSTPIFTFGLQPPVDTPGRPLAITRTDAADNDDGSMEFYVQVLGTRTTWWNDCTATIFGQASCAAARATLPAAQHHKPATPGGIDAGAGS